MGAPPSTADTHGFETPQSTSTGESEPPPDEARLSGPARALLARWAAVEATLETHAEELGALDAVAGDGDHGLGMLRGVRGARQRAQMVLARGAGFGEMLLEAVEAWSDHGGGTSGALWGGALMAAGAQLASSPSPTPEQLSAAVAAALQAVIQLGRASLGDKTMVDSLQPFSTRLQAELQAGAPLDQALKQAAAAALAGAKATADLLPKLGRARPHGQRSLGHPDPGAMSLAYCLLAAVQ